MKRGEKNVMTIYSDPTPSTERAERAESAERAPASIVRPPSQPTVSTPSAIPISPLREPLWRRFPSLTHVGLGILSGFLLFTVVIAIHAAVTSAPASSRASFGSSGSSGSSGSAAHVAQTAIPPHQTYDAQAPAPASGPSVNLTLTIKETLVSIAPNVAYRAWTFNGVVPGPALRVRVGQTVNFTLVNDGTMGHSIDFHAAQVPPNVDYRVIPPGASISFSFTPQYPGVFMYHCGASPVMDHIANGMYGAIIVDPAGGWTPAQEYGFVQSEFYTQKNADGSYGLSESKVMAMQPDEVVFNGYSAQYVGAPIQAKANQKIRIFIVNAGPSGFSAFHVIGAIFSDYYPDGNPANHLVGDQTVTIPPGGGAVVELTIAEPGSYPFVTHSFAAAMSGAIGKFTIS